MHTHAHELTQFLGGAEHAPLLIPLLEKLASAEETVIRDAVRLYDAAIYTFYTRVCA